MLCDEVEDGAEPVCLELVEGVDDDNASLGWGRCKHKSSFSFPFLFFLLSCLPCHQRALAFVQRAGQ